MSVTIVQKAASTGDPSGLSATQTATFGSSVQAGSLIVAFGTNEGAATTQTASAPSGDTTGTWLKRTMFDHTNGDLHAQAHYKLSATGGWTVLTMTYAATRVYRRIYVWEIRTNNGGSWLADTEKLAATNASGSSATSGNFSTTGTGDIIVLAAYKEFAGGTDSAWAIGGVSAGANHIEHAEGSSWAVAGAVAAGAATMTGPNDAYALVATGFYAAAPGGSIGGPVLDGRTFRGLTNGRVLQMPMMNREQALWREAEQLQARDRQLRRAA